MLSNTTQNITFEVIVKKNAIVITKRENIVLTDSNISDKIVKNSSSFIKDLYSEIYNLFYPYRVYILIGAFILIVLCYMLWSYLKIKNQETQQST